MAGPPVAPMPPLVRPSDPTLLSHREALDILWQAVDPPAGPPVGLSSPRRRFTADGRWHWEARDGAGAAVRVDDASATVWLDARFAVVERLYYAHGELLPHLRIAGGHGSPRPVSGWEWSCIGLHRLLAGWASPDGAVRADLRPALLDFGPGRRRDEEQLIEYTLHYPRDLVEGLAERLRQALRPRHGASRSAWRDTVLACAVRHRLRPRDGAASVLDRLEREGLARRLGRRVEVRSRRGSLRRVRTTTFRHAARQAVLRASP